MCTFVRFWFALHVTWSERDLAVPGWQWSCGGASCRITQDAAYLPVQRHFYLCKTESVGQVCGLWSFLIFTVLLEIWFVVWSWYLVVITQPWKLLMITVKILLNFTNLSCFCLFGRTLWYAHSHFTGITHVNPCLLSSAVKNWSIMLEHPHALLTATSEFMLRRRHQSCQ